MACSWLYLASSTTPERFCSKPGHAYCEDHTRLLAYLNQLDDDFTEIEKTFREIIDSDSAK
jgi:hypothetical protein